MANFTTALFVVFCLFCLIRTYLACNQPLSVVELLSTSNNGRKWFLPSFRFNETRDVFARTTPPTSFVGSTRRWAACICFEVLPWVPQLLPLYTITRFGNRLVRVSVFGSKSCVFLAVCGQIWPKFLGAFDLRSS